jgi:predicted nucleic acid-binding protein
MPYLLDTNVLLRLLNRDDPQHELIRSALRTLREQGERLTFTSQSMAEFWNVCTRPVAARGGYGLSAEQTDRRARIIERLFELLPEGAAIHEEWRGLVVAHRAMGVQVYDARLVAAMRVHGITHLLTLNGADFSRYSGIRAVNPAELPS